MIMLKEKTGVLYPSSSIQLDPLPSSVVKLWSEIGSLIPEESVYNLPDENGRYKYGRENNPHVTLYYGMPADVDGARIKSIVSRVKGPVDLRVECLSYFRVPTKPYDVVILVVESQVLRFLNAMFQVEFGVRKDFPIYTPHITVAFVKKDFEVSLDRPPVLVGGTSNGFVLSKPDGQRTKLTI